MTTIAAVSSRQSETDRHLAERHLHGDPEAFGEVYARFEAMVYNLALRMAGNEEEAADCAQETFLRVYRHLGRFRGRSHLRTWVFRIAVNCCRTQIRRRVRRRRFEGGDEEALRLARTAARDPEERAAAAEATRRIQDALGRVNPLYREAVVLRDLQGLTYEEISAVVGVRLGTVRSRIARGREQLRQVMEQE